MKYTLVPPRTDTHAVVNAIVEIPKGRRTKFEVDEVTGLIRLDRYIQSSTHYPGDYGFIPNTLAEDGDALDVLVMVHEPTFSGCLIRARVLGLFRMLDKGQPDAKVLAVPDTDPLFRDVHDLKDVAKPFLEEVEHFFQTYKQLERTPVESGGWFPREEALRELESSIVRLTAEEALRRAIVRESH